MILCVCVCLVEGSIGVSCTLIVVVSGFKINLLSEVF